MKHNIKTIFDLLYNQFGPQGWWPFTREYDQYPTYNGEEPNYRQKFEIATGAVLTQNTNWSNAEKAILRLINLKALYPEKITSLPFSKIEWALQPSGYFRIKTKRLKNLAEWWNGNFEQINFASNNNENLTYWRQSLLSIKGIGEETADSILLYSFNFPTFVIDKYTKRIMHRHYNYSMEINYNKLQNIFLKSLPTDINIYKEFHALFVRLGKDTCTKKICTSDCPLRSD